MSAQTDILVAGFEAFGGRAYNPSVDVARAAGHDGVAAETLAVEYRAVKKWVDEQTGRDGPELLVGIGLAADRDEVQFELRAHNEASDRADEAGIEPSSGSLEEQAPDSLTTDLDVRRLADALDRRLSARSDLPGASWSRDAGRYVCNALYFYALRATRGDGPPETALFVHVPEVDESVASSIGRKLGMLVLEVQRSGSA
ncbi:MAG: hypothetical protein ABEL76_04075 [Bradymonadaceae bacterium]